MRLTTAEATEALGRALAVRLAPGDVVALRGDLGAGKSTLARGILAGLGHDGDVPSPTFPLVIPYDPPGVRLPVWHVDLYRLDGADEAEELGLDDVLDDGALLIEWPERLGARLWREALILSLAIAADGARDLTATVPPSWGARWPL
jgi:tRNA threonylcarbamoyladenosine biosynthesis protein TsaE